MPKPDTSRLETKFMVGAMVLALLLALFTIFDFVYYIIFGILLVFSFFPLNKRLRRAIPSRALAATIMLLLMLTIIIGPVVFLVFLVWQDAAAFVESYDPDTINQTVQNYLVDAGLADPGDDPATSRPGAMANFIGSAVRGAATFLGSAILKILPGLILGLFVLCFVVFYGFSEGEMFYGLLRQALPLPDALEEALFQRIASVTKVVFGGNIAISALLGMVGATTFFIFQIPNAAFWGFIMVILGILPLAGPPFIWGPAAIWLFSQGRNVAGIIMILVNVVVGHIYVDNILRSKMLGKAAKVHPLLIFVGVMGGLQAFGILGFVIGPLVLAIAVAFVRHYMEWHVRWQEKQFVGELPIGPEVPKKLGIVPGGTSYSDLARRRQAEEGRRPPD